MHPKFSIIMPVYNSEKYISEAINSILKQTFSDFELIIIDDGSTDSSPQICDNFAGLDERIKVIHKENEGICAARNLGLNISSGDYVGFMDHDDIVFPDMLEENYKLLIDNQADWIKFGKIEVLIKNGKQLKEKKTNFVNAVYNSDELIKNLLKFRANDLMTFVWDCFILRKKLINSGLKFDTYFKTGNEDIDFCENYVSYCDKLVVNSKCYYTHFTRIGISTSSKYSNEKILSYSYLLKKSNFRYENYGINIDTVKEEYVFIVTKQILANVCYCLNNCKDYLTKKQRRLILTELKNAEEMQQYLKYKRNRLRKKSFKLHLYNRLFLSGKMRTLLMLDDFSRKIINKLRAV